MAPATPHRAPTLETRSSPPVWSQQRLQHLWRRRPLGQGVPFPQYQPKKPITAINPHHDLILNQDQSRSLQCEFHSNLLLKHSQLSTMGTVVGRLKKSIGFWGSITDRDYILSVVEFGYRLPFVSPPIAFRFPNNRSAVQFQTFVDSEIDQLISKNAVEISSTPPVCVNPLSVAQNTEKLRLILDCSFLNKKLAKFRFKIDDISCVLSYFHSNCYMAKLDL